MDAIKEFYRHELLTASKDELLQLVVGKIEEKFDIDVSKRFVTMPVQFFEENYTLYPRKQVIVEPNENRCVISMVESDDSLSCREIVNKLEVSNDKFHKVLKKAGFRPYKPIEIKN